MSFIYIINAATIAVLIGLSVMLIIKGRKRKRALWHYYVSCGSCGRRVHVDFGFGNLAAFWSDLNAKCLLEKKHRIKLDGKKHKEVGDIRSSFCWYILVAVVCVGLVIAFAASGLLLFVIQTIPGKSVIMCLLILSALILMFSVVYYFYCRSAQTAAFCFNEVFTVHNGEIIAVEGKEAHVRIGEAKFKGTVFSKFRNYDKGGQVKIYVTLPDASVKEAEALQASIERNDVTKAYTISGIFDAANAVIHSDIDFMIDPHKAEGLSELDGKYVKVTVPMIGFDIRKI